MTIEEVVVCVGVGIVVGALLYFALENTLAKLYANHKQRRIQRSLKDIGEFLQEARKLRQEIEIEAKVLSKTPIAQEANVT